MIRLLLWLVLLPIQLLLLGLFTAAEGIRLLLLPFNRPRENSEGIAPDLCSLVMLNWNGRHLLEESVPALVEAVRASGRDHQILVVDNGSSDDSLEWLAANHPEVDVLALETNLGFGEGNNRGVAAARHEIVVLLNNDMIVDRGYIQPLLDGFQDSDAFAVSSQIHFPEGRRREETGNTQGRFKGGYLHLSHDPVKPFHEVRGYMPILWAGGGSSAYRKDRFLSLGGFSEIFSPCYFEDTDLAYRAWRRGWKSLFAPASQVLHKHRSSSSVRFDEKRLTRIIEERRLWHTWKNFQLRTLVGHFLLFPVNLTKWAPVSAYVSAFRKIPKVLLARIQEPRRKISDARLFRWTRTPVHYLNDCFPDRVDQSRSADGRLRILIASAYLPHLGTHGGAGRVFQLLKRVAERHRVTLISYVEDEKDASFSGQSEEVCERVELVMRRRYEPISLYPYEPFEEFNCPAFRERLEDLLAECDFDVVHFEWTQMAMHSDLFPKTPKLMTEIEVNYAAHQTLLQVEPSWLKRIRLRYNSLQTLYRELEMCELVDRVICVTEDDGNYLKGYIPAEKLAIVNTGVDTRYFDYDLSGIEPNSIVFVGAFRHYPNLDAMHFFSREILPTILVHQPETHLYIVGSSPPKEILDLGKHPNITVTGFVPDIRDYYRKAQVVVVPLRTGVGIRGKILEGWSAGSPMVATRLACQGIEALHGENIIVSDDPKEFAMWTVSLLRNPEFCHRLSHRGRAVAEQQYEWDILGDQMTRLYEEMARSGSPLNEAVTPAVLPAKAEGVSVK